MKNVLIIAFLGITLMFSSCGKYEEGPSISLRSKKARVAGDWVFEKQIVNGVEVPLTGVSDLVITYEKDGKGKYTSGGVTVEFEWKFSDDNEKMLSKFPTETEWDESTILRLTNKEMWSKEVDGSNTTEYHLKAK